jgi:hypothetical protein
MDQRPCTVDELKQLASDRCGLTDFGDLHHEDGLEAWVPGRMTDRAARGLAAVTDLDLRDVAHVAYPDPVAVVLAISDTLDVTPPGGLANRVDRFLADQRAGRRATPPAELPSHGLDHDEIHAIPEIRRYCDQYGVAPETVRLSG